MPTKPGADCKPDQVSTSSVIETLTDLTAEELEQVTATAIREHRTRLQIAQRLFEAMGRLEAAGVQGDDLERAQQDYRVAKLNLDAQHQFVHSVIERLGYVPLVDGQRPTLN